MMSGGVRESLLSGLECENHATIVLDHARVRMWVIHGVPLDDGGHEMDTSPTSSDLGSRMSALGSEVVWCHGLGWDPKKVRCYTKCGGGLSPM